MQSWQSAIYQSLISILKLLFEIDKTFIRNDSEKNNNDKHVKRTSHVSFIPIAEHLIVKQTVHLNF